MSKTLEKAFATLRELPDDVQEQVGESLLSYSAQWKDLQAALDDGMQEIERGEGIEITDADAFVESIVRRHGHTGSGVRSDRSSASSSSPSS